MNIGAGSAGSWSSRGAAREFNDGSKPARPYYRQWYAPGAPSFSPYHSRAAQAPCGGAICYLLSAICYSRQRSIASLSELNRPGAHRVSTRYALAHQAGVRLPHLARNAIGGFIDRGIHIVTLETGLDGDMIGTTENHLGDVAIFRYIENPVNLDNPRILEVEASDLTPKVLCHRAGHRDVTPGQPDGWIHVRRLHRIIYKGSFLVLTIVLRLGF
jgi:hypothetical protein